MDEKLETLRSKWQESTAIGNEGDRCLGAEKYAAEVLKEPIANRSAGLYAQRDALRDECRVIAGEYVAEHPELESRWGHLGLEQLVTELSFYRTNERAEDQWACEAWLLANFEPQRIGGDGRVTIRRGGAR